MHPILVDKMVEGARQRSRDGVDITAKSAPFSPEQYEDCIEALAGDRDRMRVALDRIAFCGAGEDYRVLREVARKALEGPGRPVPHHGSGPDNI